MFVLYGCSVLVLPIPFITCWYDPGPSSSKENASQYACPRPVSYIESTGADDEFARKLQRMQHRFANQEEVQPIQPEDTSGMSELQQKLQKQRERSGSTIG